MTWIEIEVWKGEVSLLSLNTLTQALKNSCAHVEGKGGAGEL